MNDSPISQSGAKGSAWPRMALIRLIADERNPHRLLLAIAADAKLIDEARRLLADKDVVSRAWAEILKSQEITPEFFRERVALINRTFSLVEPEDHYHTLGLDRTATPDQVKSAFRLLSLSCHPDVAPDDSEAAECFMHIRRAYEVLSDSELRRQHDHRLDRVHWENADKPACEEEKAQAFNLKIQSYWKAFWQIGACLLVLSIAVMLIIELNWFGERFNESDSEEKTTAKHLSASTSADSGLAAADPLLAQQPGRALADTLNIAGPGTEASGSPPDPASDASTQQTLSGGFSEVKTADAQTPPANAFEAQTPATSTSGAGTSASYVGTVVPGEPPGLVDTSPESFLKTMALRKWALDTLWPTGTMVERPDEAESDPTGEPDSSRKATFAPHNDQKQTSSKKRRNRNNQAVLMDKKGLPGSTPLRVGGASDSVESAATKKRIDSFLKSYTKAYRVRDTTRILSFFDTDARENGQPVGATVPVLKEDFGRVRSVYYKIVPSTWTSSSGQISLKGEFRLWVQYRRKRSSDFTGTISMTLVPWGDSFRIKKLEYVYDKST